MVKGVQDVEDAKIAASMGIDAIHLRTDEDYSVALARFFENREKKIRHH